jgi:hypothetical protein
LAYPKITRVSANGTSEFTLPVRDGATYEGGYLDAPFMALVGDNTVYLQEQSTVTAVDLSTWATTWTAPAAGAPVMPLMGKGVVLYDENTGTLTTLSGNGAPVATATVGIVGPLSTFRAGRWNGMSAIDSSIASTVGPDVDEAPFSFLASTGNVQGQSAPGGAASKTMDDAAIKVLRRWLPDSNAVGREFGGSICSDRNLYFAAYPELNLGTASEVPIFPCQVGTTVGRYHTHAGQAPNDGPSGGDVQNAYLANVAGYVASRRDDYDRPIDCASRGEGNIWKYVMDTTVPYNQNNPVFTFREVVACAPSR